MTRTEWPERIPEGTTPDLEFDFVDKTGALIQSPATATGLIYDVGTGDVLRASFSLLPYITAGHLLLSLDAEDTRLVGDVRDGEERHRFLVLWTWAGGEKAGAHEIDHFIVNLHTV